MVIELILNAKSLPSFLWCAATWKASGIHVTYFFWPLLVCEFEVVENRMATGSPGKVFSFIFNNLSDSSVNNHPVGSIQLYELHQVLLLNSNSLVSDCIS